MTLFEKIYLLSSLLANAKSDDSVDLGNNEIWKDLLLSESTSIREDYFFELSKNGFLNYDEFCEDGFEPDRICSINANTRSYLKQLIIDAVENQNENQQQIDLLNKRIVEILTFDPIRLSAEIKSTRTIIEQTKLQIFSNPILQPLLATLDHIELHFNSLSKVANNYEDVYKNIILPVQEEGKSGIRQTVKWAIISIIASTIISLIINWATR